MFYPKCRCEYRAGFTMCSDCNIALVDKLAEENKHVKTSVEYVDYEFILSTFNVMDIAILKATLDSEEIIYFIQGENLINLGTGMPARLLVKKDHVSKAKALLSKLNLSFGPFR